MVPSKIALSVLVLLAALAVDRLFGDPHSPYHPVALLGRFIGWWGRPELFSPPIQRCAGVVFWVITAALFALPFYLAGTAPWFLYLLLAPFLLKSCFAWRSLEEHTIAVVAALKDGVDNGRDKVKLLVSRDTAQLDRNHILSAGYESLTENLTDSIVSPLLFFSVFGLAGSAVYRAANTMDAMLGYRDERERLGWCAARMDDLFNFIPARITVLLLLVYFTFCGRF
jgi:adenosylcobinamide-phosphate synthase